MIGYRIPTEGHNSMIPIYVKGFLPSNGGTNIMLPSEVTKIMGLDFDIDKFNLEVKSFKNGKVVDYDVNTPVEDLTKAQRNNQLIDIS